MTPTAWAATLYPHAAIPTALDAILHRHAAIQIAKAVSQCRLGHVEIRTAWTVVHCRRRVVTQIARTVDRRQLGEEDGDIVVVGDVVGDVVGNN